VLNKKQDVAEIVGRLTPWARSLAFFRLDADEAEDGVAEMRAKATEVCLEIERGNRSQPQNLDAYIKRVMLNALADFERKRQRQPRSLKPQELQPYARLLEDASEDEEEAAEVSGWRGLRSPAESDTGSRRPSGERQHFLARFLAFVAGQDLPQSLQEKYHQSTRQIQAISDGRVRDMVVLYFQGHEQAAIARKLSVSRAAVSQALRRHLTAWGLDEDGVNVVRYAWLYVNLQEAIREGCKAAGTWEEPPERKFELPEFIKSALGYEHNGPPEPQAATIEQYSPELCLAEEREVYKAIKSSRYLEAWSDDLTQEDMRDIIEASEPLDPWDEYDDSTWLEPP
jgi:DNA-directed RNA polymerase specialized sigma24 family protein